MKYNVDTKKMYETRVYIYSNSVLCLRLEKHDKK